MWTLLNLRINARDGQRFCERTRFVVNDGAAQKKTNDRKMIYRIVQTIYF